MIHQPAIIPIATHNGQPSVNARDLHAFLEVGKDFSNWIKDRIAQFGFAEDLDFSPILAESTGGRPSKEYALSLDMAKELSMVERNEKGKQARQYFIACEKALRENPFNIPQTLPEALRLAADLSEQLEAKKLKIAEDAPKVEFYDSVTASDTVCQMAVAAQVANLPFGRNTLFQRLRQMGVMISGGNRHNLPKQEFITRGLFTVKEHKFDNPKTNEPVVTFTTYVTQKGIDWLIRTFSTATTA